jgi:hypothetical protein
MGMFDYFRSSYYLDESFTNVPCQTKDIEDGIGGTMTQYWLSPDGQLYRIDYSETADFVELKEGDEGYQEGRLSMLNFQWIPNGIHGKVRPMNLTKYITVYPEKWNGEWKDWPECRIHFKGGVLQDYERSFKGAYKTDLTY